MATMPEISVTVHSVKGSLFSACFAIGFGLGLGICFAVGLAWVFGEVSEYLAAWITG